MAVDFTSPFTERTPRIVQAGKLHRAAGRRKAGRFLVEGENAVDAAVSTGAATDVFVTEQAYQRFGDIVQVAGHLDVYVHAITDKAAKALSDTVHSSEIFAVCTSVLWSVDKALRGRPRLVSVPVQTSEPGNAGTMIRVSDAVGADSVIFAGEAVDPLGGKVVRASAGSLFHIPVARDASVTGTIKRVKAKGLTILAATADGEIDLDDAGDLLREPTAWLFGNEAHGLGEEAIAGADHLVRIPIRGRAESLNLATAAAICLYESAKAQHQAQRQAQQHAE